MKKLLLGNLILAGLTLGSIAFAAEGGVGSGGGGTTNPSPANPEWVVSSAQEYGAKVITMWLYKEQEFYLTQTPEEQKKSILTKVFQRENGKNIYDIIANTEVEYRMSQPCRDSAGEAADGSIYGTKPGSICISPFAMAPKLSEHNYEEETLALLVHEYSHLMGANEEEAVAIQQQALYAFSHQSLLDAVVKVDLLANPKFGGHGPTDIGILFTYLGIADADLNGGTAHSPTYDSFVKDLLELRRKLLSDMRSFHLVPPSTSRRLTPNIARMMYVQNSVCALDTREDRGLREYCGERMALGFGADETVNLRTYESRESTMDESTFEPEYAEIHLMKPREQADLRIQVTELKTHLLSVLADLDHLRDLELKGYRTK